jgi:uncharacterized protein
MLTLISPAKTLNWESTVPTEDFTKPVFTDKSAALIEVLKEIPADDLSKLMDISPALATLNADRYKSWKKNHSIKNSRPAIFTFDGDVYTGFDAYSIDASSLAYAQSHLRILSGLYGVLRPLDLIQPYRLEMGTMLETENSSNLFNFWGNDITEMLNKTLKKGEPVINLASEEYFKAVRPKLLKGEVIQPVFYDFKNGQYKIISFFAKKTRGAMARYICDEQITDPEKLKAFDVDGYVYSESLSKGPQWVFLRG